MTTELKPDPFLNTRAAIALLEEIERKFIDDDQPFIALARLELDAQPPPTETREILRVLQAGDTTLPGDMLDWAGGYRCIGLSDVGKTLTEEGPFVRRERVPVVAAKVAEVTRKLARSQDDLRRSIVERNELRAKVTELERRAVCAEQCSCYWYKNYYSAVGKPVDADSQSREEDREYLKAIGKLEQDRDTAVTEAARIRDEADERIAELTQRLDGAIQWNATAEEYERRIAELERHHAQDVEKLNYQENMLAELRKCLSAARPSLAAAIRRVMKTGKELWLAPDGSGRWWNYPISAAFGSFKTPEQAAALLGEPAEPAMSILDTAMDEMIASEPAAAETPAAAEATPAPRPHLSDVPGQERARAYKWLVECGHHGWLQDQITGEIHDDAGNGWRDIVAYARGFGYQSEPPAASEPIAASAEPPGVERDAAAFNECQPIIFGSANYWQYRAITNLDARLRELDKLVHGIPTGKDMK